MSKQLRGAVMDQLANVSGWTACAWVLPTCLTRRATALRSLASAGRLAFLACAASLLLSPVPLHAAGLADAADPPAGSMVAEEMPHLRPWAQRSAFSAPDAAGILELPLISTGRRLPAVLIMLDALGFDGRSDNYARQLVGAGMAVLELQDVRNDGLAAALRLLTLDPRIDGSRIGILGFGAGARIAAASALPFRARALLYPGCATMPAPQARSGAVLLLHGQADPSNPPEACTAAATAYAEAGLAVTHRAYPGAGYAWDYPATGTAGVFLLPQAGVDLRVSVRPWPALGAMSAAQVAGFFSVHLAGCGP